MLLRAYLFHSIFTLLFACFLLRENLSQPLLETLVGRSPELVPTTAAAVRHFSACMPSFSLHWNSPNLSVETFEDNWMQLDIKLTSINITFGLSPVCQLGEILVGDWIRLEGGVKIVIVTSIFDLVSWGVLQPIIH